VKENRPDIIILDYMLPGGMDGVATLKEIRKIDREVPVIMFTAYPNIRAMDGAEKLGISAFIPKLSVYSDAQASLKAAIEMVCRKLDRKKRP
jgi:two-component system response regulator (stage 0 sporulation protein F)